jgi:hypothetical protein
VIEAIKEAYETYRQGTNIAQLTDGLVNIPYDTEVIGPGFDSAELSVQSLMTQYLATRAVDATKQYSTHFGTERWQVTAHAPVALVGNPVAGGLKVIPFTQYEHQVSVGAIQRSDSGLYAEKPLQGDTGVLPQTYGFLITPYSPKRVLSHRVLARPGRGYTSARIGVIKRVALGNPAAEINRKTMLRSNQRKFGQFLSELIEWEKVHMG